MQDLVALKGFAGVDYSGKTPDWLPITSCTVLPEIHISLWTNASLRNRHFSPSHEALHEQPQVRAKNGADFLVAFEAGCIAHEAAVISGEGQGKDRETEDEATVPHLQGPMVVIVSNDLAMNVLVAELESRVDTTPPVLSRSRDQGDQSLPRDQLGNSKIHQICPSMCCDMTR